MRIVYAMGRVGELEFAFAASRASVPSGAIVFAICSEDRALTIQDEDLLDQMIEREHSTFQKFLRQACQMELSRKFFWKTLRPRFRVRDFPDKFEIATNLR